MSLAIAARIARRELRGGVAGFRVFLACLMLGVAAIAAVGLVRIAIERGLQDQGAVLLGGDAAMAFSYRVASAEERAYMAQIANRVSGIVDFRSMAVVGDGDSAQRALVQVKGVDGQYPLTGTVQLDPAIPLAQALAGADGLPGGVMDKVLVDRLGLAVGDTFRLGVQDFRLGAVLLAAEANNISKVSHVREKMSEYALGSELAFAAGVAAAMYGEKTASGTFFPNTIFANVGRRLMGENIYHEYNMLTEIAGGLSVTMPFEDEFINPETKPYMDKYIVRNPKLSPEESHRIWRFIENVSASAMTSWYQIAGVHGGGSPIMETIALNIDFDYDARRKVARYLAGIDKELDQSAELMRQPTFGCNLMRPEDFGEM